MPDPFTDDVILRLSVAAELNFLDRLERNVVLRLSCLSRGAGKEQQRGAKGEPSSGRRPESFDHPTPPKRDRTLPSPAVASYALHFIRSLRR